VTISVDELDIAKAKVGQRAQITLDAIPGKVYQGQVTKINPEGIFKNDIATFEVTVQVEQPEGLMAGMNASVNIVVEEKKNVLWVPAQAVRVQRGQAYVQILQGGQPVQKEVEIGLRTSQQVEVVRGLQEGEQVIVTIIRPQTQQGFGLFGGPRGQQQNQPSFGAPEAPQQQPRQQNNRQRQSGR
jgi:HlyD family secretion protein